MTLSNLNVLNALSSNPKDTVYLTSPSGPISLPPFFSGTAPDTLFSTPTTTACVIVTVSKPSSIVDVFYFHFYAYNQGNEVLGDEWGNHVGDWEHTMIRFQDSVPQSMYFAQHSDGEAFKFDILEKEGQRPIGYIARGSHATYATAGTHDHTFPDVDLLPGVGVLEDHTGKGLLWDAALDAYVYDFDVGTGTFTAYNGQDPTEWLEYLGRWGDAQLPDDAEGQKNLFGQRKYVRGPTGPIDKALDRSAVCPNADDCSVRDNLTA